MKISTAFCVFLLVLGVSGIDVRGVPLACFASAETTVESGASQGVQEKGAGSSQPKPEAQAIRLQKHGQRGITCDMCHGTTAAPTPPPMQKCFGCHGNYEKLIEQSKAVTPNPHKSHMGEMECGVCHKEHRDSVLFCNKCHVFDMKVP